MALHPRNLDLAIDKSVILAFSIFVCGSTDNMFG
jgi:hypothetical protein